MHLMKCPQKFRQKLNINVLLNEFGIVQGSFLLVSQRFFRYCNNQFQKIKILAFSVWKILPHRFTITQMVFSHIHYNTDFKFWRVFFEFLSFFCHKNMHLQKCLTFGVHISYLLLKVRQFTGLYILLRCQVMAYHHTLLSYPILDYEVQEYEQCFYP